MATAPPPWRVFDAPADSDSAASDRPTAAPASGGGSGPAHSVGSGIHLRGDVLVGLAAALGGLALAWLLATGGSVDPGGGLALDGGTRIVASDLPTDPGLTGGDVVVDVAGAVLRPGVYHLPAGSRVGDAIRLAGGFGPRVAADRVDRELNLAALVHDGERVLIPSRDDPLSAASTPLSSGRGGGLVDLNSATESELDALPGIGPVTAGKIIASRSDQPFRAVQDLLGRKLVSQKTFDSIKALVTVG